MEEIRTIKVVTLVHMRRSLADSDFLQAGCDIEVPGRSLSFHGNNSRPTKLLQSEE